MNIYILIAIPIAIVAAIAMLIYALKTHRDPGSVYSDKNPRPGMPRR